MVIVRSRTWKNRKAITTVPRTVVVSTEVVLRRSMISGKRSKKDTPKRAPAAKAKKYLTGNLLFLSVKSPPVIVEKKVIVTKTTASSFVKP